MKSFQRSARVNLSGVCAACASQYCVTQTYTCTHVNRLLRERITVSAMSVLTNTRGNVTCRLISFLSHSSQPTASCLFEAILELIVNSRQVSYLYTYYIVSGCLYSLSSTAHLAQKTHSLDWTIRTKKVCQLSPQGEASLPNSLIDVALEEIES